MWRIGKHASREGDLRGRRRCLANADCRDVVAAAVFDALNFYRTSRGVMRQGAALSASSAIGDGSEAIRGAGNIGKLLRAEHGQGFGRAF